MRYIGTIAANKLYYHKSDTDHDVYDANLKGGALLHRFKNAGGYLYSAIYIGNYEAKSIVREREQVMIEDYQRYY